MITSQALVNLLNEQICNELQSHAIYLAMSAWFETTPFKGFAAKYYAAALEEHGHAMRIYQYLADRDGKIRILAIPEPPFEYDSVVEAAKAALTQERHVSEQIRRIYAKAQEVEDFETLAFLKWFLDEQVEEEKTAQDFLGYVELANGDPVALLGLDEKATPSPAPASLP